MFNNFSKKLILSSAFAISLIGCGSSGGGSSSSDSPTSSSTIAGTVAIGAGISATVEVLDTQSCDTFTAYSDANGSWTSGDLSGTSGPYLLKASSSVGFTMYSYIDVTSHRVANITPLTYYATDSAARSAANRSIASMYASCNNGNFTGLTNLNSFETEITNSVNTLNTHLENASFTNGNQVNFNHFNGAFEANQTGYDALLDEIDMSMNNNDTVIRVDGQILETSDSDITAETNQTVTSKVVDSSGANLQDVTVTIKKDDLNLTQIDTPLTTDTNGEYTKDLEKFREYVIEFSKTGYTTTTLRYKTFEEVNPQNIVLLTEDESSNSTEVTPNIEITDSRNGEAITDVTIKIREGFNNRIGNSLKSIETSENTTLSLVPGNYTLELSKSGYELKFANIFINSETTTINLDMLSINESTEVNSSAFATIILRWGENPEDADSHTQFMVNNVGVDVYYENPSYGANPADRNNPCATSNVVASLDLDDVTSYGPETTTICDGSKGPFEFKVHHFSGSSNIGASPTTVELITRNGSRYEFIAPATGFTGEDDVWNVFRLNTDQNVTRINTVTKIVDFGELPSEGNQPDL